MAYSDNNRAYGRMMRAKADDAIAAEVFLAQQIMADEPGVTRDEALRRAARIVAEG